MYLDKNEILFQRGENGELLGQEIELLEFPGKNIKAKPLTRGQLQKINLKVNSDNVDEKLSADTDVITLGLVEPKLSDEEIKNSKPNFASSIVTAIVSISLGISQEEVNDNVKTTLLNNEMELKKK